MFDFRFNTPIPSLNQGQYMGFRESIGASPEFQKNFHDPLVVKTCNVFSKKCYMFSPTKGS
jgi:hypothetical protein